MADSAHVPDVDSFDGLVASRRTWIEEVLKPWCRQASRINLLKAEQEWTDLAGRAAPEMTLWPWAWSRFPALYVDGLNGINETYPVEVTLKNRETFTGFPNNKESERGGLVLMAEDGTGLGPFPIDEVVAVSRVDVTA